MKKTFKIIAFVMALGFISSFTFSCKQNSITNIVSDSQNSNEILSSDEDNSRHIITGGEQGSNQGGGTGNTSTLGGN
jgi:hypothetical protein